MVILVVFMQFKVVKKLEKPDPVSHQKVLYTPTYQRLKFCTFSNQINHYLAKELELGIINAIPIYYLAKQPGDEQCFVMLK